MNFLKKLAQIQYDYRVALFVFFLIFTIIVGFGISKIQMQSDINKEMPQHLDIFQLNDKIRAKFGGMETIMVLFMIDEKLDFKNGPKDIRNVDVVSYLQSLEESLSAESSIESVVSLGTYLDNMPLISDAQVRNYMEMMPATSSFVSDDYKKSVMFISVDVGSSDKKIIEVTTLIKDKIQQLSTPSGVKYMITGSPPVQVAIFDLLKSDSVYTVVLASIIILFVLFILERSITKGLLVFVPLVLGLIWTIGTMGWIGLKISVATAGLGAMILGLGVEYGVFMLTRYKEERKKGKDQLASLSVAVPGVGQAILGSGTTTIVGFLALTISIMPMLVHLGQSLALGIFYCLFATVVAAPIIIILEEDFEFWLTHRNHNKLSKKKQKQEMMPR